MEGWLQDLWTAAKAAGPFATMIMLLVWHLERQDRLTLQRERDALLERVLKMGNDSGVAISAIKDLFERALERNR